MIDPARSKAGVGVNVGDEVSAAGGEASLASKGEALARLVDERDAAVRKRDVAGAVRAGIVDDDDLESAGGEGAGLVEDRVEAGWEIGLFVVRGNDEA